MRRFIPRLESYIDEGTPVVASNENSHEGLIVPELVMEYGVGMNVKSKVSVMPKMIKTLREMAKSYKSISGNLLKNKTTISDLELNELKEFILSLGVDHIGFAKVEPSMIFKGKKILYNNAIVITMEMKREAIDLAPSSTTQKEIFRTYYELGVIVNRIAAYMRKHGFNAQAGPALGGDVNYPLIAEKAGLGVIGKHGLLITPNFGPSLRIATIYTDISNLPFTSDNEHLWVKSFCSKCNRCTRMCPAQAIYKDIKYFDDNSEEHIDYKKCAVPFSRDNGCTVCVKECSFYKADYFSIKEKFDEHF